MILDFHMNGAVTLRLTWRLGVREPGTPAFVVAQPAAQQPGSLAILEFGESADL